MTSLLDALRPRDQRAAARVLVVALMLAMLATVGWEVVGWLNGRPDGGPVSVTSSLAGLLVSAAVGALILRAPHRVPLLVWPAVAVLQPVGTAATVIASDDASAGAQFGLVYAVVFAASQFGRLFAWCVTALAVAVDAVIVFSVLPVGQAVSDLLVVACALPMITIVLQMTNAHGDRLRADLDALATTDALTGVSTRRALETAAARLMAARADDDPQVGLVLLDVDRFKQINDRYGHPTGDDILVGLAGLLQQHAGQADVVARLGGDELAVLVSGDAGTVADRAAALHEAIRAGMGSPTTARPPVTVSMGYAVARPGKELEELYRAADRALYEAKAAGRDRVVAEQPWGDLV